MVLIDTIKPNKEKKFRSKKFMQLFRVKYKIKPVLFLFMIDLLAATKTLSKEKRKIFL